MKGTTIQISLRDARALLAEARGEGNPVTYMAAIQRLRERAAYAERREERRKKEQQK